MSFTMYMGMIVGMLAGGLSVAVALLIAKKKGVAPLVEEDERTEQVNARAGYLTFLAALGFSFVGWVTDNVLRNGRGEPVAFISPWSLIFFAMVVIYLLTWLYESRKVSDNEAAPDDKELKKMNLAVMAMGLSVVLLSSAFLSAGDRIDGTVKLFLWGLELLMLLVLGFLLGQMHRRRKKTQA
jgi:uncharacterized membrane protein